eukprot:3940353-Rhodomonas_salina.2
MTRPFGPLEALFGLPAHMFPKRSCKSPTAAEAVFPILALIDLRSLPVSNLLVQGACCSLCGSNSDSALTRFSLKHEIGLPQCSRWPLLPDPGSKIGKDNVTPTTSWVLKWRLAILEVVLVPQWVPAGLHRHCRIGDLDERESFQVLGGVPAISLTRTRGPSEPRAA